MSKNKAAESSELKVALEKLEVMHNESLVRLAIRQAEHIEKLEEKLKELQDLSIWMTGCGYDFTQHEHYQKNKHLLNQDNEQ